jgi:hypothetical protein
MMVPIDFNVYQFIQEELDFNSEFYVTQNANMIKEYEDFKEKHTNKTFHIVKLMKRGAEAMI